MQPYFAAEPMYSPRVAARIMERVDRWYERLPSLRAYQRARRIRQAYFGLPSDASPFDVTSLASVGAQGELSALNINQLGVLGQRLLSMTVQDDLGWQPVAANMDATSQQDTAIARSVLDYERRVGMLDRTFAMSAETAFLDASAWLAVRWDVRGGTKYDTVTDPATGAVRAVYSGRLRVTLHAWWRTVVDLYRHDTEHEWIVLVDFHNKYDLAARFAPLPEQEALRNRLLSLSYEHPRVMHSQNERGTGLLADETPLVPVYCLYHRPTEAVPQGRETWVVDAATVLYDGAAVYGQELPAVRIAPGEWLDTPHGHTPLVNLVAPQEALNMAVSSTVTNNASGAVAKLWIPPESNLNVTELDGAEVWQSENEPKAITTSGNNTEAYKLSEQLQSFMVSLAHLNSAALGQQERAQSGALAALFDAKAREAIAPFIRSYRWAVEQVGTRIVDCYKRFAKVPRSLEVIAGADRRYMLKDFTGAKLESIARVTVEARNSLLDTTSGKLAFVENLMQMPAFLNNPRAMGILFQIHNTGRIDPLLLDPETEDILIQRENEMMLRGEEPAVMFDDPHEQHLAQHRRVAANPETRLDPAKMAVYEAHMAEHRLALSQQAMGALGPGMPPPATPQAPGDPSGPPTAPTVEASGLTPMDAGPNSPGLPSLPVNPATGERAEVPAAA